VPLDPAFRDRRHANGQVRWSGYQHRRLRDRRTPCGRRLRWRPQDSECERLEVLHDSGEMRGHWKVRWVGAWRPPDHTIQSP
jgi:hypothetical protein